VIYDRPVHELLAECARGLREPFTRAEILAWFRNHYPAVEESTVSAHIAGLTPGGFHSHAYLGTLPAVIQRVGPGLYRRARPTTTHLEPAAPLPAMSLLEASETVGLSDVILIGCVKSKLPRAAAARDLYTSPLFARRRRYAEATGLPWFVVSSRWGLVAPEEVVAPYDVYLGDMSAAYRRTWAEFVTAQLSDVGPLPGTVVEIHAGDHYVNSLRPALVHSGAVVVDAVDAGSMGETLAWYDHHRPTAPATAAGLDIGELVDALSDSTRAVTPDELRASSRVAPRHPARVAATPPRRTRRRPRPRRLDRAPRRHAHPRRPQQPHPTRLHRPRQRPAPHTRTGTGTAPAPAPHTDTDRSIHR